MLLRIALKAYLGLQREVALLRDVARVPKEVEGEAEVEDASPGCTAGDVESPPEAVDSSSGHTGNCIDLKRGPR